MSESAIDRARKRQKDAVMATRKSDLPISDVRSVLNAIAVHTGIAAEDLSEPIHWAIHNGELSVQLGQGPRQLIVATMFSGVLFGFFVADEMAKEKETQRVSAETVLEFIEQHVTTKTGKHIELGDHEKRALKGMWDSPRYGGKS